MPWAHTALVLFWVWFSNAIVCSIVSSATKPIYRRAVVYPSNITILVALKVLSYLVFPVKGLIVM